VSKKADRGAHGQGKGTPEFWVAAVKPGRIMFEIGRRCERWQREALRLAAAKLSDQDARRRAHTEV